jgi:ribonuclease E
MDIMKIASISRKEGRALRDSMGAPEMPAKEVSPEFGFREASPSVAAAALAALKTGGPASGDGRRARGGTRRSTASPAAAPAEEAPVPAPAATLAEGEEQPRRRRRRGGRGRGRTRREDEGTPATAGEEIGWEEFDDLSQLDGAAEREFTFEEADAATLAELGLSPEDLDAPATDEARAEPAPEEKPKRRRSTRSTKVDEREAAADAEAATEEKPKRRRSTRKTAEEKEGDAAPEAVAEPAAEEKPKRRTSTRSSSGRTKKAAATEAADDPATEPKPARRRTSRKADETSAQSAAPSENGEEPQGIWGRFRSARKPRGVSS